MIINLNEPTILQSLQLAATGVVVGVLTYAPLFMLLIPEFNKFSNREVAEHQSGNSYLMLAAKSFFIFPIFAILAILLSVVTEYIFPNLAPVYGDDGLINNMWNIDIDKLIEDDELAANNLSILYFLKHTLSVLEMMSFLTTFIFLYLSFRVMMEIFQFEDTNRATSFFAIAFKGILVFLITGILTWFYSEMLSNTLQHPEFTISELSIEYAKSSVLLFTPAIN